MTTVVRADALATLLADAPSGIEILSLDCFDTLIWRNVNAPVDVFADLPFAGGGMEARMWGERKARKTVPFQTRRHEVTIEEIYEAVMPQANEAHRTAAIDAELAAEASHCFAFAPVCDLIADARRRGLKVIIVSDTYLSEPQLRALIAATAGVEVADQIDRIFCSCAYGISKAGGLFTHVLADLGIAPSRILHVGDNRVADQVAPAKLGVQTVHFDQFDALSEQRLRLETVAATLLDRDTRSSVPAFQPHRAPIALRRSGDPLDTLGHDVLGPMMHAFALWLRDEAQAMEARCGRSVKLLFLLRDGHLPAQTFAAAFPELADRIASVELSRYTAQAAAFADAASVRRYVTAELAVAPFDVMAKQMLFTSGEVASLARAASKRAFLKAVLEPANVAKIVARSAAFAARLFAHLGQHGVDRGDAVMLVDLGYNGSVQNAAEHILRAGMGLDVAGRYLLLRETFLSGLDKEGFLDVRHYDAKALHALSESIAIVEQLCTLAQGSVIDYAADGTAIRRDADVKGGQNGARDAIQAACIDFARHADHGIARAPLSDTPDCRRRMAAAILGRLLFLPMPDEVAIFETFDHDVNLGTGETLALVDADAAAQGLRRRGLFYAKNAKRAYLPGEMQRHGLPINLSLFASRRFGLDLRKSDFDVGAITLPVMLMGATSHAQVDIAAHPTSEGYYQALIPVGAGQYTVGIQLGLLYDWVQIEEASFHIVDEFMDPKEDEGAIAAAPIYDAMEEVSPGLYRTAGANGFMLVPPPARTSSEPLLLSIVLRPVVARTEAIAALKAA